jgi:DUF1365 family protein
MTGPAWFRPRDYLELDHDGPVRVLTHVRTFGHLGMDSEFRVRLTTPGKLLRVHMESCRGGASGLRRHARAVPARTVPWPLLRYPFMTLRVVAGIYAHAVRLGLRGAPYHPHPKR